MRKSTIMGRDYKLTEEQYKRLLRRLDIRNAVDYYDRKAVYVDCICPGESIGDCPICPLGPRTANCLDLMKAITDMRRPLNLHFNFGWVSWPEPSEDAKKYLAKVRSYLLAIPKTT